MLITCSSLHFKRIIKRIVNKAPKLYSPLDRSSSPHYLVARDHVPDASHKLYHKACKLVRQLTAKLFQDSELHAAWISPVCYMVENQPMFVLRISLSWYNDTPRTDPNKVPSRVSLLIHPGIRKSPDYIKLREGCRGPTLQLESCLNIFPRQYRRAGRHWDSMFLASIKRSLAAADLACSNTPYPIPPPLPW